MRAILKRARRLSGDARDRAAARLARLIYNRLDIRKYGKMTSFTLDTEHGELRGTLELKGEEKPVEFRAHFHLTAGIEGKVLEIDSVWTSREWLTLLAQEFVKPGSLAIPLTGSAAAVLKILGL